MKATLKGRYEADKTSAAATLSTSAAGDLRLKASITDATVSKGPSLHGLSLSLEKPGSFVVDLNVPKQDVTFMFMNSVRVLEKQVNLVYTHTVGDNRTAVDGTVVLNAANKVSGRYAFGKGNGKVKYVYAHGEGGRTVVEPSYDFGENAWDFGVTRKFEGGDSVRAVYGTAKKGLAVEWNRDSKVNGCFKITASFNLAEQNIVPKLMAETSWNYEI